MTHIELELGVLKIPRKIRDAAEALAMKAAPTYRPDDWGMATPVAVALFIARQCGASSSPSGKVYCRCCVEESASQRVVTSRHEAGFRHVAQALRLLRPGLRWGVNETQKEILLAWAAYVEERNPGAGRLDVISLVPELEGFELDGTCLRGPLPWFTLSIPQGTFEAVRRGKNRGDYRVSRSSSWTMKPAFIGHTAAVAASEVRLSRAGWQSPSERIENLIAASWEVRRNELMAAQFTRPDGTIDIAALMGDPSEAVTFTGED